MSVDDMGNVKAVLDIFNTNGIQNRYIDTAGLPRTQSYRLNVPAVDDNKKPIEIGEHDISLIVSKDNIFAYKGKDITTGEKHTYATIGRYLKGELKAGYSFEVIIKPTDNSSYKNIVDVLDEMKTNKIEKYALMDITKEEDAYVKTLK